MEIWQSIMILFLLLLGLLLLAAGLMLAGNGLSAIVPARLLSPLVSGLSLTGTGWWLQHRFRGWRQDSRLTKAFQRTSPLAQQLFGSHTPYVIEAAQQLGAARDTTAVPALMAVLERCVDEQQPAWREVAEALANALAQIGDGRALPLLYRLENVRGIGFIPAIRSAIAAIEPQSSLLRAGNLESMDRGSLLRPTQEHNEDDARLLLRAGEHNL